MVCFLFLKLFFFILSWGRASLMTQRQRTRLPVHQMQEMGFYPWAGRAPGEGNGSPLQGSCWEIQWTEKLQPTGWQSRTQFKWLNNNSHYSFRWIVRDLAMHILYSPSLKLPSPGPICSCDFPFKSDSVSFYGFFIFFGLLKVLWLIFQYSSKLNYIYLFSGLSRDLRL